MQIVNTPWGTPEQIYNITRAGKHIWAETRIGRGVGIKNCKRRVHDLPGVVKQGEYTWFGGKTAWAVAALYSPGVIDLLCGVFQLPAVKLHRMAMRTCSRHYPAWMIKNGYLPLADECKEWMKSANNDTSDIIIVGKYITETKMLVS